MCNLVPEQIVIASLDRISPLMTVTVIILGRIKVFRPETHSRIALTVINKDTLLVLIDSIHKFCEMNIYGNISEQESFSTFRKRNSFIVQSWRVWAPLLLAVEIFP